MRLLVLALVSFTYISCFAEAVSNDTVDEPSSGVSASKTSSTPDNDKYADRTGECQDIAAGSCMGSANRTSCLNIVHQTPHLHQVFRSCMGIIGSRPATKQELLKKMVERYPQYKSALGSMIKSDS